MFRIPGRDLFRPHHGLWASAAIALLIAWLTLRPPLAPSGPPGMDKVHHMVTFAILVLPTAILAPRHIVGVALAATVFGGAIEIVQPLVGRGREFYDFVADLAGIAAGSAIGLVLSRK